LRKVLPPDQGRTLLEGTLVMQERITVRRTTCSGSACRSPPDGSIFYGHLYTTDGLAQGEARFRTIPQALPPDVDAALRAAEGVSFARSPFEVVPLLSTPCDMYALGVLAVRTFAFPGQSAKHAGGCSGRSAKLARQAATNYNAEVPLSTRIGTIMDGGTTLSGISGAASAGAGTDGNPWRLSSCSRVKCGTTPLRRSSDCSGHRSDSYARILATRSACIGGHSNKPLEDFEKLLVRSRSLVVIDWNANREVHSAIRRCARSAPRLIVR